MQFELDFRSRQPIYIQIVEQIRQQVAHRELQTGDQLPTVRQLAADLRVNFNTVARAYRLLDEAGLISTQHGRGTYVWETPSPEVAQQLRSQGLREMSQQFVQEALQLGYAPEEIAKEIVTLLKNQKERDL
jgi:GntR family transcriptional regulator